MKMAFKLTRLDAQSPDNLPLPIGVHIVGRGKFLHYDENDKRVSRNHAQLEVTNEYVKLKALHQNPCFFKRKNDIEAEVLQRDCTISLRLGDGFGLIPGQWYIVNRLQQDTGDNPVNQEEETSVVPAEVDKDIGEQNGGHSGDPAGDNEETIQFENNEDTGQNRSPIQNSPSMNNDEESTEERDIKPILPLNADTRTPVKRACPSENIPVDLKKVKTERDDGENSGEAVAGPSNAQASSDSDDRSKDDDTSHQHIAPPQNPSIVRRERCLYGANCYRRNTQHQIQFSHPADQDWGDGERGVCPYGAACVRRDLRHWNTHDHPPGTQPPHPPALRQGQRHKRRQRKTREVSDPEDSEEDSPARDLIVTGKRARKTIQRQDLEASESEREDDPYGTDESDEWQPPSDLTGSQDFSQAF